MAITQAMATSFKVEILDEQHDLAADTLKIALYTSSASLGAGTTAFFDAADPTWTTASFTARGALIYNDTNGDKAIAVLNFGGDFTVSSGTFRIVFPAAGANAIITIA